MRMTRVIALLAAAGVLLGLAAGAFFVFANRGGDAFAACREGAVAGGAADIGGPFTLVDAKGARVDADAAITGPTLVYFGYAFCPDFCPNDLARNGAAVDLLAEDGVETDLVFISIDPARDTPEEVGNFTGAIHPGILGLTGTEEEVAAAANAYRVYYRKAGDDPDYYLMDHSTFTYLMAPEVGFLDYFGSDVSAADMADRVSCFAQRL
jgi:protein SCO1